jgi:hypothetical protein
MLRPLIAVPMKEVTAMKFSIRDVLWLTAMVAGAVAWWLDHRNLAERQRMTESILIPRAVNAQMEADAIKAEAEFLRVQLMLVAPDKAVER